MKTQHEQYPMLATFSLMLKWVAWFKFVFGTILALAIAFFPTWSEFLPSGAATLFSMGWIAALVVEIVIVVLTTGLLALSEFIRLYARMGEDLNIIRKAIDKA